jgi:hypothetical protein
MNGSEIIYYDIEDANKKTTKINSEMIFKLAETGAIKDYTVVELDNQKWLKGINGNSLKDVPIKSNNKKTKLRATETIVVNNKVMGIIVTDENNEQRRISNKKAWELAQDGLIDNVEFGIDKAQKVKTIKIGGSVNE